MTGTEVKSQMCPGSFFGSALRAPPPPASRACTLIYPSRVGNQTLSLFESHTDLKATGAPANICVSIMDQTRVRGPEKS